LANGSAVVMACLGRVINFENFCVSFKKIKKSWVMQVLSWYTAICMQNMHAFIVGGLLGFFFPWATMALCAFLVFAIYKLNGNKRLEEFQATAWAYLAEVQAIAKLLAFLRIPAMKPMDNAHGFGDPFIVPVQQSSTL
jgi:hypothetical protein